MTTLNGMVALTVQTLTLRPRAVRNALGFLALLGILAGVAPGKALGAVSVGAPLIWHSPDDINTTNIPGLLTLSGNDNTVNATMPFSVVIGGTSYSLITISTNGWIEFGGNTQGTSDPTNASLPTSKHTNPFLAAYWDDLNTFGDNIRYGVVGTSPDRTYVIDFQEDVDPANEGGSADDIRFQVEIHESSNVINVRYGSSGHTANGQAATIGFQGAGGAGATAFPLTFNGKILDDNRPDEGWSIDVGRSDLGVATMAALMACSPDDIGVDTPGFTTLTGDNSIAGVTLPFSVTVDGTSYSTATIGTNGLVQFGTTTGANPTTNAALPSSSFPNPTLFWYWDDLQTFSSNIQYGTVGTSPNRTFIIDFQENRVGDTGNVINGQVEIHETSNVMNVKYRSTMSAGANGQSATIGFQGAGGASAAAYPLTFNGKILDDNLPDAGWSVSPLRYCGDGIVQSGAPFNEQCDLGAANGTAGSCCTASCTFSTAVCRSSAGACDPAETCSGASTTCPGDT